MSFRGLRPYVLLVAMVVVAVAVLPGPIPAGADDSPVGTVTRHASSGLVEPTGITTGPDGNMWFIDRAAHAIGKATPDGEITLFEDERIEWGSPDIAGSSWIVSGPDGNLWFTNPDSIGRITPAGTMTFFADGQVSPGGITTGPDGNLWFTHGTSAHDSGAIGRMTPSGVLTMFTTAENFSPAHIASGPAGDLWFSNSDWFEPGIGRVTVDGDITLIPDPLIEFEGALFPTSIDVGADGTVWYSMRRNGWCSPACGEIGRYDGEAFEHIGAGNFYPDHQITHDPDGNVWVSHEDGLARFSPAGEWAGSWPLGYGTNSPRGVTWGPDDAMWFTRPGAIGEVTPAGEATWHVDILDPTHIVCTPDGNLWFSNSNKSVGRLSPDGNVTSFPVDAGFLELGADGDLWFGTAWQHPDNAPPWAAEHHTSVSRLGLDGDVLPIDDGSGIGQVNGSTIGPGGDLWLTNVGVFAEGQQVQAASIVKITPTGAVTHFRDGIGELSWLGGIVTGPDGNLWVTGRSLAKITPDGVVTVFDAFTDSEGSEIEITGDIVAGADGHLWTIGSVTDPDTFESTYHVLKMATDGSGTVYTPANLGSSWSLAAGPDGHIWFTQYDYRSGRIGRIDTDGNVVYFDHPTIAEPASITSGPDGAMWFTNRYGHSIGRITAVTGDLETPCEAPAVHEQCAPPFNDVATSHPFCAEIAWMAAQAISTGFEDGSYRPGIAVTRQAMSAFMARLAGAGDLPACSEKPFVDVAVSHPFCAEIAWMADAGISTGFTDGTYRPGAVVTRQAMSAFMARMAGAALEGCSAPPFSDVATDHTFCEAIRWMAETGVSTGFTDGTFRPGAVVTRQAMSAFMYRLTPLL